MRVRDEAGASPARTVPELGARAHVLVIPMFLCAEKMSIKQQNINSLSRVLLV